MFYIRKPKQKPIVVIRAATSSELFNYEKQKLVNLKEKTHENKIETNAGFECSKVKPGVPKEDIY